ncbi:hypothetical protein D3C87_1842040 [compost metagenome]
MLVALVAERTQQMQFAVELGMVGNQRAAFDRMENFRGVEAASAQVAVGKQ